jgi:putative oxidoreductase
MIDTKTAPYAALTLRVALGTMLVAHALLKVFVFTLPGTVQFFQSLGLPSALAYVTVGAELVGGVLLILGVGTRWVAAALVPVLIGATWVHAGNGWLFSAPNGGWEYPAFWTVTLIVQALLGDGAYALGKRLAGRPAVRLQAA